MQKLIVLDHNTNTVHIHSIERNAYPDEEYLENIGYNCNNCQWMAGNIEIVKHKGILK